jgi:hypothetical protein
MSAFTFDETLFSDFYKDAYGFRPRDHEFYSASDDRKQEIWDRVLADLNAELEAEYKREAAAILEFQARICEARSLGAQTDADALRWIMDAEGLEDLDLQDGGFEYHLGLPFGNHPFKDLMEEVAAR